MADFIVIDWPAFELDSESSRPTALTNGATAWVLSVKPVPAVNWLGVDDGAGLPPIPITSSLAVAVGAVGPADGLPVAALEAY